MITKIYPPKGGWHCLESLIIWDLSGPLSDLARTISLKIFLVLAFSDGNYFSLFVPVNNLVVASICKIIVSFYIGLTDDFEVNLYIFDKCRGWRHLTAYCVVWIINWKSIDTTVLIPFVHCVLLLMKELLCSVVEDFWYYRLILQKFVKLDVTILSIVLGYVSSTYGPCWYYIGGKLILKRI